jgi:hypothetical protein
MAPFTLNLAVPSARLVAADDVSKLSFVTGSWLHLNTFINIVEGLPADFKGGSEAAAKALDALRQEAGAFGSPKALRQLLVQRPNALAKTDGPPSPLLYIQIVWLAQLLHSSAGFVSSYLKSLAQLAGSSQNLTEDVKPVLRELGGATEKVRTPIGPLIDSLKAFKGRILSAYNELSDACKTDAEALQKMQESVGGLQVRVESLQKQIDQLGIFSTKAHRTELEQQLVSTNQELGQTSSHADKLRAAIGQLEPILNEGNWLESGVDDFVDFLGDLRKVLTTFGSGLTQLAVDSAKAQIGDPAALRRTLGLDEGIEQWTAIDQAARQFTVDSLVDKSAQ